MNIKKKKLTQSSKEYLRNAQNVKDNFFFFFFKFEFLFDFQDRGQYGSISNFFDMEVLIGFLSE